MSASERKAIGLNTAGFAFFRWTFIQKEKWDALVGPLDEATQRRENLYWLWNWRRRYV